MIEFEENVRRTMGVEFPGADFLAHHSPGVDAKIGRPMLALSRALDKSRST